MTKGEFLELMNFPSLWSELGMYPDELFKEQITSYEPGHEQGSEHDRNGAFHWWLRKNPSKSQLGNLLRLAYADPDQALGADVRNFIRAAAKFDDKLERLDSELANGDMQ